MSEINLTSDNFEKVIKQEGMVLVDFFATWCGPCKMLAPVLSKIAEENEGKVKIAKVDVDEQRELAIKFGIESIPTLILFKDGEKINEMIGLHSKSEIESMIND